MESKFTAKAEVTIKATPPEVWNALTDPDMVKQYLFGTNVKSDWKVGSPIIYTGEWEGKQYTDRGEILQIEPEKVLVSTYWSSMSGKPDIPENYNTVTYLLEPAGEDTKLTVIQDNVDSKQAAEHSMENWKMVLGKLKEILEEK